MSQNKEPLGTYAKFASGFTLDRTMRYALQSVAASLLPEERVHDCQKKLIPVVRDVEVMREKAGKGAWYRNLQVCASVWMCPVCASRITEGRRREVQQCLDNINCRKVLVTYTLRHNQREVLRLVLTGLKESYEAMWSGRWQTEFKDEWGYIGAVKTLEVTYGENGFHPHFHTILFLNTDANTDDLETGLLRVLRERWLHCLKLRGRDANWKNGLKVTAVYAGVAEYVAKWGHEPSDALGWDIVSEVTKSPSKTAHRAGKTPLGILRDAAYGDKRSKSLWKVYALTFKGSPQIRISPLVREMAGLKAKQASDATLAGGDTIDAVLFAKISFEDWRIVLRHAARGRILDIVQKGDVEEFLDYLQSLGCSLGNFENITDMMWRLAEERAQERYKQGIPVDKI